MQNTQNPHIRVSVSFGERGTVYGCGHAFDTFLFAFGLYTESDLFEDMDDFQIIGETLDAYDWKGYTLARLNGMKASELAGMLLKDKGHMAALGAVGTKIIKSEFLPGDWLRFDFPDTFAKIVKEDREQIETLANDSFEGWEVEGVPVDLQKQIRKNLDSAQKFMHDEWLNGDRSNDGVLRALTKALFGSYARASVGWDTENDSVTIDALEEDWREFYDYDLDERDILPEPSAIAEYVRGVIIYKCEGRKAKADAERAKRTASYKENEERKARLLEVEKEAARKRKADKESGS